MTVVVVLGVDVRIGQLRLGVDVLGQLKLGVDVRQSSRSCPMSVVHVLAVYI